MDQEHSGGDPGEDRPPEGGAQGAPPHAQDTRQAPQQQQEVRLGPNTAQHSTALVGAEVKDSTRGIGLDWPVRLPEEQLLRQTQKYQV